MSAPRTEESSPRPLKVALISHSDTLGGAAIVTRRLMQALRAEGVDARMVVFNKLGDDTTVLATEGRFRRGYSFMAERARIALANGFSRENLFKVSTGGNGLPLHNHPWVLEADIIVLGWINQGLLSLHGLKRLAALGKPIVWTMHDMWCLTGICHHAYECRAYLNECGNCQFLTSRKNNDLSHKVWRKKHALYSSVPVTFVAVSSWLAKCCRESSLLRDADVRVIPNAFPVDSFPTSSNFRFNRIGESVKRIILMGAARLDDPIKGLPMAIDVLNYLFDTDPEAVRDTTVIFFGDVRDKSAFANLRLPYLHLGTVDDGRVLRHLYSRANVVISTSLYETLPGTIIEGQAGGAIPVSFGRGGQADIIDHKVNGYIARYKDIPDFAAGISWALKQDIDRDELHESVRRKFSARSVARRYIDLFHELLAKNPQNKRE